MMKSYRVFIFVFLALLPVLFLRDYTPGNELRYLSIADEAIKNGSWITFSNHGEPYADKPPLYFWIIMAGKWLLGEHCMWFLSLFSLIPAFIIVSVMNRWVAGEVDKKYLLTGELLMLSCGLFVGLSLILRMDMLMCMFIVLSLYTFHKMMYNEGNMRFNTLLFPIYIFLAVFTKGPIGILIPLFSTITFLWLTGRIRSIGRYWGWKTWGILFIGCLLWFGAVYWEGGKEYLNNLLFHQTIDRAVDSFHHKAPFYYYFVSIWYSLFPWSLLLVGVITVAVCKEMIHTELQKFFFVVIVVTFLLLSLISSKIEVYMLPAFPFIVYLTIMFLPNFSWNRWLALSISIPSAVFACFLPVFMVLVQQNSSIYYLNTQLFYIAASILTLSVLYSVYILYKRKQINISIRVLFCGLFCSVFVGGWRLSDINAEIGYRELCAKGVEVAQKYNLEEYYVWGLYRPENMDVYLHKSIQVVSPDEFVDSGKYKGVFMLPADKLEEFPSSKINVYRVGHYAVVVMK